MKLLVHHHAVAHKNSDGIWIHSTMGKWINELALYFQNIGLLVHVTKNKIPKQDTCITNKNVILHSLGTPGIMWDKIQRTKRIRRVCHDLDNQYDSLLIRGITPRQYLIWNNIKVLKKYFLLVGSPYYSIFFFNLRSLSVAYHWYMERYRRIELRTMLKNGSLIVNALNMKQVANEVLNTDAVFVPTNTISEKQFSTFKVRKIGNPIRILFCGRIEVKKGIIEAIKAVSLLRKAGHHVQLDLVGPVVDQKFHQEINVLINELNVQNHIIFRGRVPYGDELFDFYRKSDIFILPSYTEGFPHVLWEAASSCCPVITTSVGGIPSFFKDRYHGVLIPPRDFEILADSIIELLSNNSLISEIVSNAYNLALEYTVEKCAKKLAEVIKTGDNEQH